MLHHTLKFSEFVLNEKFQRKTLENVVAISLEYKNNFVQVSCFLFFKKITSVDIIPWCETLIYSNNTAIFQSIFLEPFIQHKS